MTTDVRDRDIAILFEDPRITQLFSELLRANGVETVILESAQDLSSDYALITEPQFYPLMDGSQKTNCLLVTNPNQSSPNFNCTVLSRPLTEEKIEAALKAFLG